MIVIAAEARPYSLVVACISFALVCYQRAPALRWTILLGLSLALAQSFHYYAVFAFVPFFASEAVLSLEKRQVRWGVWVALVFGFLPLVAFWPMLSKLRSLYGEHYCMRRLEYGGDPALVGISEYLFSIGIALAAISAVAVLGTILYTIGATSRGEHSAIASLQEPIMILAFLSLPFVGYVAVKLTHGGLFQSICFLECWASRSLLVTLCLGRDAEGRSQSQYLSSSFFQF